MSMIEATPQRKKNFDGRKQDHGDAAEQKGHYSDFYEDGFDRRMSEKRNDEQLRVSMHDSLEYGTTVPPEDEYLLSLKDAYDNNEEYEDDDTDEELNSVFDIDAFDVDNTDDRFITPEDLGLKSRREIGKLMARRVTLDPEFDREDDEGDSDYPSPLRIHNLR